MIFENKGGKTLKLVVGLGNPGMKYAATRHNIGFEIIDSIAETYRISVLKNKYKALIGEGTIGREKVILMKPQTYMNLSGEAIRLCSDFYKISPEDVIVIYDDVSLELGQIRIRKSGSAGGHNGIKSIIACLGTQTFPRIKFGVGDQFHDLASYVLDRFSEAEMKCIGPRIGDVVKATEAMICKGVDYAMNQYNGKMGE